MYASEVYSPDLFPYTKSARGGGGALKTAELRVHTLTDAPLRVDVYPRFVDLLKRFKIFEIFIPGYLHYGQVHQVSFFVKLYYF